jgi:hypothetical protein
LINERLGYRNFNVFLNRYRIDEANAALSDPSQREVGADHRSGRRFPVNRTDRSRGMTPIEFRRRGLVQSRAAASRSNDNFKIGQSRSKNRLAEFWIGQDRMSAVGQKSHGFSLEIEDCHAQRYRCPPHYRTAARP